MEIFRPYDIRGEYGIDITDETMYRIGRILSRTFSAKTMVIAHDVVENSKKLHKKLIEGSREEGINVIDLGCVGTDVLYFAVGHFGYDFGLMVTASHAAGNLSGLKIMGPEATPFGKGFGMEKLKEDYENYIDLPKKEQGSYEEKDIIPDFIKESLSFVDKYDIKPMRIVVDASNSVGAIEIDELEKHVPQIEFIKINWELDGTFPGHSPNPFLKENREELRKTILEEKADFGISFDGDADRIYFLDHRGEYIFGVYTNGLIAKYMCEKDPGRVVLHDIRAVRYIQDIVRESGGTPKRELIGHSYFKKRMKEEDAIFGAESSGHVYYNFGNYSAENSIIAFLQISQMIKEESLHEMVSSAKAKYPISGEYNFSLFGFSDLTDEVIRMINQALDQIREKYSDGKISDFDTLTVEYQSWNFNIRPSANDPVIRLNVEAKTIDLLDSKLKELKKVLKKLGFKYTSDSGVKL